MPRPRRDAHLYELAKRGAQTRLADIAQETKYLLALFPDLRDSFDEDELPLSFIMARDAGLLNATAGTRRQRLSPSERHAIGSRIKKYWSARRKGTKA
jgi:hypothetical protein